jgi:hypothetical protein
VAIPLGIILVTLGASIVVAARRELAFYNQPTDPGLPTKKIVTSGVFSVSRNPLYLGGYPGNPWHFIDCEFALGVNHPNPFACLLPFCAGVS